MTSESVTALSVLRYVSIAATAVFGVLGAAFETRIAGKLNTWGKFAIVGIICSALIGTLTQTLEARIKQAEDDRSAKTQSETSLRQAQSLDHLQKLTQSSEMMFRDLSAARDMTKTILGQSNENLRVGQDIQRRSASTARDLTMSVKKQEQIATSQRDLVHQSYRLLTPLEPVLVDYVIEYPADALEFHDYAERLRALGQDSTIFITATPDATRPGERAANSLLKSTQITLELSKREQSFALDSDLTLMPMLPCAPGVDHDDCSTDDLKINLSLDSDPRTIRKVVRRQRLRNVSRAGYPTIASQLDLIGSELMVSIDHIAPHGTKLVYVEIRFGGPSRSPVYVDFHNVAAAIDEDPEYGARSVTFSKQLTQAELGLRLEPR